MPKEVADAVLDKVKQFTIGFGRAGDDPAAKGSGVPVAGVVLVVLGFIGVAFRQNRNSAVNESSWTRESTPTERLKAMREFASASAAGQLKAKGK